MEIRLPVHGDNAPRPALGPCQLFLEPEKMRPFFRRYRQSDEFFRATGRKGRSSLTAATHPRVHRAQSFFVILNSGAQHDVRVSR